MRWWGRQVNFAKSGLCRAIDNASSGIIEIDSVLNWLNDGVSSKVDCSADLAHSLPDPTGSERQYMSGLELVMVTNEVAL